MQVRILPAAHAFGIRAQAWSHAVSAYLCDAETVPSAAEHADR